MSKSMRVTDYYDVSNWMRMIGGVWTLCAACCVFLPSRHLAAATFVNPTDVNLLERWNPDGTYGNGILHTVNGSNASTAPANTNSPLAAIDFALGGVGWRNSGVGTSSGPEIIARYTFPSPMEIGEVRLRWRDANHSPNNYTVRDDGGVIASSGAGPFAGTTTHTFAPRTASFVEFEFDPAHTNVGIFEMVQLGAFLAPGEQLAVDGTFNVLYQPEGTHWTRTGFAGANNWDDKWNGLAASPSTTPDSATWEFSEAHLFHGAYLNHQFAGNPNAVLEDATIEISSDGVDWTTVFGASDFVRGYMDFTSSTEGRFVRLSWSGDSSPGLSEITEFQIFGAQVVPIPEPSSAALVGLGAWVLVGQRTRHRRRQNG